MEAGLLPEPPVCGHCGKRFIRTHYFDEGVQGSLHPTCEHYKYERGYLMSEAIYPKKTIEEDKQ